ncbi:MAG: CHAT domain-containing protein [Thermoguttaceae bacterium]
MSTIFLVSVVSLLSSAATPDAWFYGQCKQAEADLQSGDLAKVQPAKDSFTRMLTKARDLDDTADNKTDWMVYCQWKDACCDYRLGRRQAAERALEDLIRSYPKHGLLLLIHRDLGQFYLQDGKTDSAQGHLQAALDLQPHWSFRNVSQTLADWRVTGIKVKKAEVLVSAGANGPARQELQTLEKEILVLLHRSGGRSEEYEYLLADIDTHLAELERRNSNYTAAIDKLGECLKRLEPIKSPRSLQRQICLHIFQATYYSKLTRFDDGDAELERVEPLFTPPFDNNLYSCLENKRAELKLERVMCGLESNPTDRSLAEDLDAAEKSALSAMAYQKKAGQEDTIATATSLDKLAKTDELRGRIYETAQDHRSALRAFERAKSRADQSIALFKTFLPADHDILLELRRTRADLSMKLGDSNGARSEINKVLRLSIDRYGPQCVECAPCHQLLIELEARSGNITEAAVHAQAHRRLANERFPCFASGLTAVEQVTFFRRWNDPGLQSSLRLGVGHPPLWDASAEWLLNGKAKTSELLAHVNQQVRGTANLKGFREAVQREAYFLYAPHVENVEAQLLAEEKTKRDLAEKRASPVPEHWYELSKLRAQLTAAEVYVDCFCLNDDVANAHRAYYAWVVTRSDPLQVIKLGDARQIDQRVAGLLSGLEAFRSEGDIAEEEEKLRRDHLQPLSEMIFTPLRKAASGKLRWIISPDGSLWNVPWAALILAESNEYAVKTMTFRYAISARDLFGRSVIPGKLSEPLIIADPGYDLISPGTVGSLRRGSYFHARRLPESRAEGLAVAEILKSHGANPVLRLQEQATKEAVLDLDLPPRILYLSTHGFFLPPDKTRIDDPFLCCGVAFAAFNFIPRGEPQSLRLPGLMTAAEVLTANLQGTELVVLSACQTGTGIAAYGHSAASLRHAFHLAGAKVVVSTLWSVEDRTTKDLMVRFMNDVSLSPQSDKADALRRAQLKLIDALHDGPRHHTHPYLWAAFTLSGF